MDPSWPWAPITKGRRSPVLEILLEGPLSRAELARRLDLSPATLTRLTRPHIDSGLLTEMGAAHDPNSRGSRPLDLVSSTHHFIGVRVTENDVHAVVTDLRCTLIDAIHRPLTSRTPPDVARTVADMAGTLTARTPAVRRLGMCLGGLTEHGRTILRAPFLGWTEPVPLADMLEEATALPTTVDNDLLALTRAEHWFGIGRHHDHFAVITIGTGIGYGLVANDTVIESTDAGVGLIEHFPLDPYGPTCRAGHRGCASAMLSMPSIQARAALALQRSVSYADVLDLAHQSHPAAVAIITEAGRALGRLIAAVANLTMAHTILVTGEGSRLVDTAREHVDAAVNADRDPAAQPLSIVVQPMQADEWARGAAVSSLRAYIAMSSATSQQPGRKLTRTNNSASRGGSNGLFGTGGGPAR